ncbi:hypothetical protein L7F22_000836 [Adiantum nelumboides]|nr:hypothetical protein [Adiantum nelumboides]
MSQDALNSSSTNPPNPWSTGYLPHKSLITNNSGSSSLHQPKNYEFFSEAVHALPKDLGNLLEQAHGQRHGVGVFSQQSGGKLFQSQHLFDGGNPAKSPHSVGEPSTKAAHGAALDPQQADGNGTSQGSPPKNSAGKVTVILSAVQVRKAQADLEGRALIGMIAERAPLDRGAYLDKKMPWKEGTLDIILVPAGLLILLLYHAQLAYRIVKHPTSTVIGVNDLNRRAWVRTMMADSMKNGVLSVQTLRNNIMASTLLATAAITLCSLIAVLVTNKKNAVADSSLVLGDQSDLVSSLKLLAVLICFLAAFLCNVQAVRYYGHASFLVSIPMTRTDS